eukprot:1160709-Pelagomonas_calceolata.AAC.8
MPGRVTHDSRYLQDLVGDALARGCAEVITAQPNDPVEYLGQYLMRYVKNVEIIGDYTKDKEAQLEAKKAELVSSLSRIPGRRNVACCARMPTRLPCLLVEYSFVYT